jgi:hypothetical protein
VKILTCTIYAAFLFFATPCHAYRIIADAGGKIGDYLEKYENLRDSNEMVIIDGPCASACTLVLGIIPRHRICRTKIKEMMFGFHAAYDIGKNKKPVINWESTKLILKVHPPDIRAWIRKTGAYNSLNFKILKGRELARYVKLCKNPPAE